MVVPRVDAEGVILFEVCEEPPARQEAEVRPARRRRLPVEHQVREGAPGPRA